MYAMWKQACSIAMRCYGDLPLNVIARGCRAERSSSVHRARSGHSSTIDHDYGLRSIFLPR